MINCEQFEDNFLNWKNNNLETSQSIEMRNHSASCKFCADITIDTIELRESIAGISAQEPSGDFEVNLNRRISEIVYENKAQKQLRRAKLPRWAALGAGMATGLAIGIIILIPANQNNQSKYMADSNSEEGPALVVDPVEDAPLLVIDTTIYNSDSSKSVHEDYKLDDRSKLVSGK